MKTAIMYAPLFGLLGFIATTLWANREATSKEGIALCNSCGGTWAVRMKRDDRRTYLNCPICLQPSNGWVGVSL